MKLPTEKQRKWLQQESNKKIVPPSKKMSKEDKELQKRYDELKRKGKIIPNKK